MFPHDLYKADNARVVLYVETTVNRGKYNKIDIIYNFRNFKKLKTKKQIHKSKIFNLYDLVYIKCKPRPHVLVYCKWG